MAVLKKFRDRRLAHSLMGEVLKSLPLYKELFQLMDVACEVTKHARLAIYGSNVNFMEFEDEWRRQAEAFWKPAIEAAEMAGAAG